MLVGNYYAFQLSVQDVTSSAYYYINVTTAEVTGGAVTIYPSETSATYFTTQPYGFACQAPPATSIGAGLSVVTSDTVVSGTLGVGTPINSDVLLQLYGSQLIGSVTLRAGEKEVPFAFKVTASEALPVEQAQERVAETAPRPQA